MRSLRRRVRPTVSGQNLLNDFARHIGEAVTAAVVEVGQPFVIHPEQVEHRGVQVVDADAVHHGLVADLIGLAVARAALDARAGHPGHETVRVMIAAAVALRDRHAAELAAPDHQRAVHQAAPLQVRQQAVDRQVGGGAVAACDCRSGRCGRPIRRRCKPGRIARRARSAGGP